MGRSSAALIVAGLAVAGCGGGGGSMTSGSGTPGPTANQSPGGIWTAQYVESQGPGAGHQINLKAAATEAGDLYYAAIDTVTGCADVGYSQVSVSGSAITGTTANTIASFAAGATGSASCTYPDGSTYGTGSLSGTIAQRSSLKLTISGTTSLGNPLPSETQTWSYSNLYELPSSLATLTGNYADGANTMTINSSGGVFEQDAASGCVINGQVSVLNASYNAYGVSFTFSNCAGTAAALNGHTATGIGYFDNTVSPSQVLFGLRLTINGATVVIAGSVSQM